MWWRSCVAASLALLCVAPAAADELAEFNAAVEQFSAHHRVALHYLRSENIDFAVIEIERMREAWSEVVDRFGTRRPAAITDVPLYTLTLTDVSTRMIGATLVLNMGRADVAAESLGEIRQGLARLRRASGIAVLADCVLAANTAMDALAPLAPLRDADLAHADARTDVLDKAGRYGVELKRCESIASPEQRGDPEFRRLVDGANASIAMVRQAIEQGDSGLLGRLIDELRAFDRLLAFRYG
jgi:hypothetical protein